MAELAEKLQPFFLTKKQLEDVFNLSRPTLNNFITEGLLKPIRLTGGRNVYFDSREVYALRDGLVAGTVKRKPPPREKKKKTVPQRKLGGR